MRQSLPVDRMVSQRREAAAMAVKPLSTGGKIANLVFGPGSGATVRTSDGRTGQLQYGEGSHIKGAIARVGEYVGRQFVGRPGERIGGRIAESVERDLIDRINIPSAAKKIVGTTKNVYTESGMYRGKDVFLESLPKTDEMMDAIIKGQFTKAARTSAMVGRHAAGAAKEGIKVGLAVGGAAGAAGAAVVNKLFGRDDKKKGK